MDGLARATWTGRMFRVGSERARRNHHIDRANLGEFAGAHTLIGPPAITLEIFLVRSYFLPRCYFRCNQTPVFPVFFTNNIFKNSIVMLL